LLLLVFSCAVLGCQQASEITTPEATISPELIVPSAAPDETPSPEVESVTTTSVFSSTTVERVLSELTKPENGGRLSGSAEIYQATLYLAETFEDIGLALWNGDSYILSYSNQDMRDNERLDFIIDFHGLRNSDSHNIVGIIPGLDQTKAIVVSAHYDAIGGGMGALDNASGVAAMLRVAENLLFLGDKPETDIVFVAFDGEEVGLIGSRFFVPELVERYDELYNINIDSVGMPGIALALDISVWADEWDRLLRSDFAKILDSRGISYIDIDAHLASNSDNITFSIHGIATLPIGLETERIAEMIHSENDVIDVLDIALIEDISDAVVDFIITHQGTMY